MQFSYFTNLKVLTIAFIIIFLCVLQGCKENSPVTPLETVSLKLSTQDISSTEAILNISVADSIPLCKIILYKDSIKVSEFYLLSRDTLILEKDLISNAIYSYKADLIINDKLNNSSQVVFRTMDTSSHSLTWERDYYSYGIPINDVAAISENSFWFAGVYINPASEIGNLLTYDNGSWNTQLIPSKNESIESIYSINRNNIWLGTEKLIYFDGNSFINYEIDSADWYGHTICSIWAKDKFNVYLGGRIYGTTEENFAFFNGTTFKIIPTGITDLPFYCVVGDNAGSNIWLAGYLLGENKSALVHFSNGKVNVLYYGNDQSKFTSIWIDPDDNIFIAKGNKIYKQTGTAKLNIREIAEFSFPIYSMSGIAKNDIFVTGKDGGIGHYNGATVQEYKAPYVSNNYYLKKIIVKGNKVIIGGYISNSVHGENIKIFGYR